MSRFAFIYVTRNADRYWYSLGWWAPVESRASRGLASVIYIEWVV